MIHANKMSLNAIPNSFKNKYVIPNFLQKRLNKLNDRIKCKIIQNNTIIKLL